MQLRLNGEGSGTARQYPLKSGFEAGYATQRVKPAKGLKNRYWQFGFNNVEGCNFTIDSLELETVATSRKATRYNMSAFTAEVTPTFSGVG